MPTGRRLRVAVGTSTLDFTDGDLSVNREAAEHLWAFAWGSTDDNDVLEVNVLDDFRRTCPATFDLPTTELPVSLYLSHTENGAVTPLANSDAPGATGKLTLELVVTASGQEEMAFRCTQCRLPTGNGLFIRVDGEARDRP